MVSSDVFSNMIESPTFKVVSSGEVCLNVKNLTSLFFIERYFEPSVSNQSVLSVKFNLVT